jgi:hypothetical protein
MIDEKSYMFNPFKISRAKDEDITNTYSNFQDALIVEPETGFEIASNIERYANMNYLLGEMISRYKEQYNMLKNDVGVTEAKQVYMNRKQWQETNAEKPPAMSYFEAMAKEYVKKDLIELGRMEAQIDRFKNAYNSITEKQNALKKKLEIIKYEL